MMRYFLFFLFIHCSVLSSFAQHQEVPKQMEIVGITVKIQPDARKLIQKDVDALTRGGRLFDQLVEKIDLHLPLIEKILQEEGLPNDFKYLPIQESSLRANAVSSSNAVGYWQFKKGTAEEVGIQINNDIDERMHLAASTRGACQYLKKSQAVFNNWLYALVSYNMGFYGAKAKLDQRFYGSKKISIDKNTHWYMRKFIAHKIAFQNAIGKHQRERILWTFEQREKSDLEKIAQIKNMSVEDLKNHNQWIKKDRLSIKENEQVLVLIPHNEIDSPIVKTISQEDNTKVSLPDKKLEFVKKDRINRLPVIYVHEESNIEELANQYQLSLSDFMDYNDLTDADITLQKETPYYLSKKRKKATQAYHIVEEGENIWEIAQKYGIRKHLLLKKNRMTESSPLDTGRVLWLRNKRPKNVPVEFR